MSSPLMKRVRKEIRSLSESEWYHVVRALWIMKVTSDTDGKLYYGSHFISYDSMISKHMVAAFDPRGDQAHFGPILGLYHRAWLLELENSLRSIDGRIEGLPYWDYTKDVLPLSSNFTSIFDDRYFGSSTGQAPDYSVTNGRFAKWPIKKNDKIWKNSYGYMRHPLSSNKSPYLTRKGGTVCGYTIGLGDPNMWDMCMGVGGLISEWTACVDSNIHGPAHSSIAGSWRREGQTTDSPHCTQWFGYIAPPANPTLINQNMISRYTFGSFVNPYAKGCFYCPTCDDSQSSNNCMCVPRNTDSECGPLWTNLAVRTSGSNGQQSFLRKSAAFLNTTNLIVLVDQSTIQMMGDLGDPAASPNDPMFWAHHANIDRHFETWMIKNQPTEYQDKYYNYPREGFAEGCNLNDVINSMDSFTNLNFDISAGNTPYTVKDIFDQFTGDNTPYTYDSLLTQQNQRRPPSLALRGINFLTETPYRLVLRRSLQNKPDKEGNLDQDSANHKIALEGILRGEYKKYTVPRLPVDIPYYIASAAFIIWMITLQCLFNKYLHGKGSKKSKHIWCKENNEMLTSNSSTIKSNKINDNEPMPKIERDELKVSITKEMKNENIRHADQSSDSELKGTGSEMIEKTVGNNRLGLHCRTPNSTGNEKKMIKSIEYDESNSPSSYSEIVFRSRSPRI